VAQNAHQENAHQDKGALLFIAPLLKHHTDTTKSSAFLPIFCHVSATHADAHMDSKAEEDDDDEDGDAQSQRR